MVLGRMGLLDEAIRDHLELKRRRGADPEEVARAENEALAPVFPADEPPETGEQPLLEDFEEMPVGAEQALAGEPRPAFVDEPPPGLAEETVEIDMEAVLAADAQLEAAAQQSPGPVRAPLTTEMEDESLEWELPDRATAEPPPEPLPGQEHLPFE
jgi:hypothetical protein